MIEPQNLPTSSLYHPLFAISKLVYLLSLSSTFPFALNKSNVVIRVPVVTKSLFKISDTAISLPDVITVWNLKPVGVANLTLAPFCIATFNLILVTVISLLTVIFSPEAYATLFVVS